MTNLITEHQNEVIIVVQIMSVLYLMFAIRLRVWRTSLNTFIVILGFFLITTSRESEFAREFWINYHLTIVALIMTFLMVRVVYQSASKKFRDGTIDCAGCPHLPKRGKDDV